MQKTKFYPANYLLPVLVGLAVSAITIIATKISFKWAFASVAATLSFLLFFLTPGKKQVLLNLFIFFLPLRLNFALFYEGPKPYSTPVNSLFISAYDILFFLLVIDFFGERRKGHSYKCSLYREIFLPFVLIIALIAVGMIQTPHTLKVKISTLWIMVKSLLVFLFFANLHLPKKTLLTLMIMLTLTVGFQSFLGILQKVTGGLLGLKILGETQGGFKTILHGVQPISRVAGTLGHPNRLSAYLGLFLPISGSLLFTTLPRSWKMVVIFPLFIVGILINLLTFSRGGWLSMGIGLPLMFTICFGLKTRKYLFSLLAVATACIIGFIILISSSDLVRTRIFARDSGAAKTRIYLLQVAKRVILKNPLFGVGYGNYAFESRKYDHTNIAISYRFPFPPHTEFVNIAAESGIPVLVLVLALLFFIIKRCIQTIRGRFDMDARIIAAGIFCGIIGWVLHHFVDFAYILQKVYLWTIFGVAYCLQNLQHSGNSTCGQHYYPAT